VKRRATVIIRAVLTPARSVWVQAVVCPLLLTKEVRSNTSSAARGKAAIVSNSNLVLIDKREEAANMSQELRREYLAAATVSIPQDLSHSVWLLSSVSFVIGNKSVRAKYKSYFESKTMKESLTPRNRIQVEGSKYFRHRIEE